MPGEDSGGDFLQSLVEPTEFRISSVPSIRSASW